MFVPFIGIFVSHFVLACETNELLLNEAVPLIGKSSSQIFTVNSLNPWIGNFFLKREVRLRW